MISDALRWEIWERDNFTCKACSVRRFLSIDHIVPRVYGGTDDPENLQTLCRSCNSRKGESAKMRAQVRPIDYSHKVNYRRMKPSKRAPVIQAMLSEGMAKTVIARKMGLSTSSIRKICKEHQLKSNLDLLLEARDA